MTSEINKSIDTELKIDNYCVKYGLSTVIIDFKEYPVIVCLNEENEVVAWTRFIPEDFFISLSEFMKQKYE